MRASDGELWVAEGTVEKHVRSILNKLNLPETADDHRRVRAVIAFLEARVSNTSLTSNAVPSEQMPPATPARLAGEQLVDGIRRQVRFRYEPHGGARRDHVGEVLFGVRRGQDDLGTGMGVGAMQLLGEM